MYESSIETIHEVLPNQIRGHAEHNITSNRTLLIKEWDTVWDWTLEAKSPSPLPDEHRSSRGKGNLRWYGGVTFEEAMRLLTYGWSEIINEVQDMADSLRHEIEQEYELVSSPMFANDLTGLAPDIGRFLMGHPEDMINMVMSEQSKPVIKILASTSMNFNVPEAVIRRRGIITVALVDILEDMGVRCEVVMNQSAIGPQNYGFKVRAGHDEIHYYVKVKRADQPLAIDQLLFMMAHPASLRRIGHSVRETEDTHTLDNMDVHLGGTYGTSIGPHAVDAEVYIPPLTGANTKFLTDEAAKTWLVDMVREQGIELVKEGETL